MENGLEVVINLTNHEILNCPFKVQSRVESFTTKKVIVKIERCCVRHVITSTEQNKPPVSAKKLASKLNILVDSYITAAAPTNLLP
jgi:hypothetical protein